MDEASYGIRCPRGALLHEARPPKATLEKAVAAHQRWLGGTGGYVDARTYDKLYKRLERALDAVVKASGLPYTVVQDQVGREAERRGMIRPMPGKDY